MNQPFGDAFSLADITWIPQLVVLNRAGYPFSQYAHFERWKNAVMARPSFKQAVTDWLKQG
ncbi:MAG: glutathione S-transferase family protein [Psychrobacter sp.]|uniref:glutathione S-transferase family protein n=1 Tax=unclassified Psychrobacter TaxID=196806 RepID=UPI00298F121E|nr:MULTISPECIES: glutathione binding-like protein [unclassified Psychrobacter]